MESIPLSDSGSESSNVPTMGGTAIANPMDPAFPQSGHSILGSQNQSPDHDEKKPTRPTSFPSYPGNSSHSYSAPNSLSSPGN